MKQLEDAMNTSWRFYCSPENVAPETTLNNREPEGKVVIMDVVTPVDVQYEPCT